MISRDLVIQALLLLGVLATAFFVLVRPQIKRLAEHERLLASVKLGDHVLIRGGIVGEIVFFGPGNMLELELAPGVRVRAIRDAIDERVAEASG